MPELPEVEVTRRSFAARIEGARVVGARMGKSLRWPLGCDPAVLEGRTVVGVRRRGKYLLLDFDQGLLLLHLGMSGSLSFLQQAPEGGVHDHFDLHTTRGTLRLHDPRRFGAVVFAPSQDAEVVGKLLGGLGMEPLSEDFDLVRFSKGLKSRRSPIKQVLLAGDVVVGVGNIYASEVLFHAGIRPTTRADRIGPLRTAALHAAVKRVLARAVERGGSTLRDFVDADGEAGHFQIEAMVYGRAGQPCRACGTAVRLLQQGQRSTYFCHVCQRN